MNLPVIFSYNKWICSVHNYRELLKASWHQYQQFSAIYVPVPSCYCIIPQYFVFLCVKARNVCKGKNLYKRKYLSLANNDRKPDSHQHVNATANNLWDIKRQKYFNCSNQAPTQLWWQTTHLKVNHCLTCLKTCLTYFWDKSTVSAFVSYAYRDV